MPSPGPPNDWDDDDDLDDWAEDQVFEALARIGQRLFAVESRLSALAPGACAAPGQQTTSQLAAAASTWGHRDVNYVTPVEEKVMDGGTLSQPQKTFGNPLGRERLACLER